MCHNMQKNRKIFECQFLGVFWGCAQIFVVLTKKNSENPENPGGPFRGFPHVAMDFGQKFRSKFGNFGNFGDTFFRNFGNFGNFGKIPRKSPPFFRVSTYNRGFFFGKKCHFSGFFSKKKPTFFHVSALELGGFPNYLA